MGAPMSLSQQIVLRYRAAGHIRFSLPALLCEDAEAERLIATLKKAVGIYRVDLFRRQNKLSIRYTEGVSRFSDVARALRELALLAESEPAQPSCWTHTELAERQGGGRAGITGWIGEKVNNLRDTVAAFGILARGAGRSGSVRPSSVLESRYVNEFFTDALVLYLIRLHWHMITQHWLRQPWVYRYEWTAALYLIYLLVRSKRPKT
jgi:hypothetical protein